MEDLPRPEPLRSLPDQARAVIASIGVGRVVGAVLAGVAVVAVGWWLVRPPAPPIEDSLPRADVALADPAPLGTVGPTEGLLVHVGGAVRRPGVYRMAVGDRVVDAIERAGGARPRADLDAVNLAAPVADGQQVIVPRHGQTLPAAVGEGSGGPTGPVDVNRAGEAELDELPGVGPSTAAAIVRFRDENGPFATVDDLEQVPGIGPAKLDALRDLVTV